MHNAVKALNVTELCTFKWLIVCYVNFTAIKKKKKMGDLQELKTMGKNFTPNFPDFQGSTPRNYAGRRANALNTHTTCTYFLPLRSSSLKPGDSAFSLSFSGSSSSFIIMTLPFHSFSSFLRPRVIPAFSNCIPYIFPYHQF